MKTTIVQNTFEVSLEQVKQTVNLLSDMVYELPTPTPPIPTVESVIDSLTELAAIHFDTELGAAAITAANKLIEAKRLADEPQKFKKRGVVADWFDVHGHRTNLAELSRVFNLNSHTLRNRYKSGWPLEAALVAEPDGIWKYHNVMAVQNNPTVIPFVKATLNRYFDTQ